MFAFAQWYFSAATPLIREKLIHLSASEMAEKKKTRLFKTLVKHCYIIVSCVSITYFFFLNNKSGISTTLTRLFPLYSVKCTTSVRHVQRRVNEKGVSKTLLRWTSKWIVHLMQV